MAELGDMLKFHTGRLLVLGPEGWEPVADVTEIRIALDGGADVAVQVEQEHWCGDDPEMQPEPVLLGTLRFCSGCGAWLDHPETSRG